MTRTPRKPKYRLTFSVEAANIASVESKIQKYFGDVLKGEVKKIDLPNSRPDRLKDCEQKVHDAMEEVEELRTELEDWYDALPDSFQNGDQGENMQEAMDNLQAIHDELENVDFSTVSFPGMRG